MYGSIEVGKYANFTALNQNPLMIKDNQIKDIEILGTVLKGDAIPLN
jgi:predicted amidohydrolase YtcJ